VSEPVVLISDISYICVP